MSLAALPEAKSGLHTWCTQTKLESQSGAGRCVSSKWPKVGRGDKDALAGMLWLHR